jgi:hypothetical protein
VNARVLAWFVVVAGGCGGSTATTDMSGSDGALVTDLAVPDLPPTGCAPRPVPHFKPKWSPPRTALGTCSAAQVDAFVTALLAGDYQSFIYSLGNQKCGECLVSHWSEAELGPVINFSPLEFLDGNQPGCMALVDGDASPTGCGAAMQVALNCGLHACGLYCKTQTQTDFKRLNGCIRQSWEGVCKAFAPPDACSASLYDRCDPAKHPSVAEFVRHVSRQFCGGAGDGGA